MFIVVDTVSRNVLGEFENAAEAEALFVTLVAADPAAYRELKVLSESGEEHTVPHEDVRAALDAAVG